MIHYNSFILKKYLSKKIDIEYSCLKMIILSVILLEFLKAVKSLNMHLPYPAISAKIYQYLAVVVNGKLTLAFLRLFLFIVVSFIFFVIFFISENWSRSLLLAFRLFLFLLFLLIFISIILVVKGPLKEIIIA